MNHIRLLKSFRRRLLRAIRLARFGVQYPKLKINPDGFFCGKGAFFGPNCHITIGKNFYMGRYCHIAAHATIGDDVLFASCVSLVGGDHVIDLSLIHI